MSEQAHGRAGEYVDPAVRSHAERRAQWRSSRFKWLYSAIWLVFLGTALQGVDRYTHGPLVVVGYLLVAGFCVAYLWGLPALWAQQRRRIWLSIAACTAIMAATTPLAHQSAFVMTTFVAVLLVGRMGLWSLVPISVLTVATVVVPKWITAWHTGYDTDMLETIPIVSLAMAGMFGILHANSQLAEARTEVARLAAENERTRIARDLHDLLGHSLTTITVKAGLAARLVDRDPARAAEEIRAVEELTRRSLADVRAAVAGYRDVTLAGEVATAREVLRSAGIGAQLPGAVDVAAPELAELFGWVLRESITNVVRHSRASRCCVTVGPRWLAVEDDGRGGTVGAGNGLTGVRERVTAAGGTVGVHSGGVLGAAGGWRVRVDVPASVPAGAADPATV